MNEAFVQQSYFYFAPPANTAVELVNMPQSAPVAPITIHVKAARISRLAKLFAIIGLASAVMYFVPSIASKVTANESWVMEDIDFPIVTSSEYQPQLDASLALGSYLAIPKIGVNTTLHEETLANYENALKMGVWRVQDYGSPYDRTNPTILVAHRFGYLKWSNQYRHENSFYNLPKLEAGDRLEIVWRQRKYIYEIYASSEGTDIADYSANLILYTCKDLTGDIKIFKYARLLEI